MRKCFGMFKVISRRCTFCVERGDCIKKVATLEQVSPFVLVEFPPSIKQYTFRNTIPGINRGDTVVCDTCNGAVIGVVKGLRQTSDWTGIHKFIIQKIDLKAHREAHRKEIELEELKLEYQSAVETLKVHCKHQVDTNIMQVATRLAVMSISVEERLKQVTELDRKIREVQNQC